MKYTLQQEQVLLLLKNYYAADDIAVLSKILNNLSQKYNLQTNIQFKIESQIAIKKINNLFLKNVIDTLPEEWQHFLFLRLIKNKTYTRISFDLFASEKQIKKWMLNILDLLVEIYYCEYKDTSTILSAKLKLSMQRLELLLEYLSKEALLNKNVDKKYFTIQQEKYHFCKYMYEEISKYIKYKTNANGRMILTSKQNDIANQITYLELAQECEITERQVSSCIYKYNNYIATLIKNYSFNQHCSNIIKKRGVI